MEENVIGPMFLGFMIIFFMLVIVLQNISFLSKDIESQRKNINELEKQIWDLKYNVKQ